MLRRVAPPQRENGRSADWLEVEHALGTRLPTDYRELIDDRGPGIVADVVVYGPDNGGPLDLVAWNDGIHRLIESIRDICRDAYPPAFHPEPAGVLPWGSVNGGQIVGWAVTSEDPDEWPVVVLSAELDALTVHEVTTTGYLLARLPGPNVRTLITG
ncbi:SMI1/KNR4 family protein [Cryptosporangium sp. NPDC051539]|uniref:SMI1/KNR4 family protein n=1 Tax=Cryptosporangium sp. NPDC051539 TaxID=3363962 RepID=UPI0037A536D5